MSGPNRGTAYQETRVLSASPQRLVPLLYEHLLVNIKRGAACVRRGDIPGKHSSLTRASDIVTELLSALDFEAGGELAQRLASLYAFWATELSKANRHLDAERLDRIAEMVASLHEAWEEAARLVEQGAAGEGPAP